MPLAYVIRFDKKSSNPYFPGQPKDKWSQPDSQYPHWEVCEPRIRKGLDKGSILFFVTKGGWKAKYVLKVEAKETEEDATALLGKNWRTYYDKQVWCHKGKGTGDIIVGSEGESFSLPDDGEDITKDIPTDWIGTTIRNNGTHISIEEARQIYRRLWPLRVRNTRQPILDSRGAIILQPSTGQNRRELLL